MMPSDVDDTVRETVATVLADHPVAVGFLFGSQARGTASGESDIDVAVAFKEPDIDRQRARLQLGVDLALALGTDDIDVVDLRSASPTLVRTVFRTGDRIFGSEGAARRLREELDSTGEDRDSQRSPTERFDDALAAIDDHLA